MRVIDSIVDATCKELGRVGYSALRVEDVAARADVHKTSVYRRWPTKAELVVNAIRVNQQFGGNPPDTGNLRNDLMLYFRRFTLASKSEMWMGILSTLVSPQEDPVIAQLAKDLRKKEMQKRTKIVQRGIDRGELPVNVDPKLVGELIAAPVMRKVLTFKESVTPKYLQKIIDIVISGAIAESKGIKL
jgi:AcrR family transcriptional regulator